MLSLALDSCLRRNDTFLSDFKFYMLQSIYPCEQALPISKIYSFNLAYWIGSGMKKSLPTQSSLSYIRYINRVVDQSTARIKQSSELVKSTNLLVETAHKRIKKASK